MNKYPRVAVLTFLLAVLFILPSFSQESDVDLFFNKGIQKYLMGDLKAAISDLGKAIKMDPDNEKTRKFLVKALVEFGSELADRKDYAAALPLLKRAYKLAPGDPGVKNAYVRADSSLKAQQKEDEIKTGESDRRKKEREAKEKKKAKEAAIRKTARNRKQAAEAKKRRDRVARENRAREDEIIKRAQEKWDKKSDEQLSIAEEWEKKRSARQSKTAFIISFLIILGVSAVIFVLISVLRRNVATETATTRQEGDRAVQLTRQQNKEISDKVNQFGGSIKEILTNQMERILKMMEEQSRASSQETVKMEITRPDGTSEIRTDINPHIRARANGVELIEDTIDDPATGEKLIEPFLTDVDSRVRANAGKAMYKYNKEKAMVVLDEMCKSSDQWNRLSASWAMGEIANEIAIEDLLMLLDDPKDFVVKRSIQSLETIVEKKGNELEEELTQKIERRVKDARIQRKIT